MVPEEKVGRGGSVSVRDSIVGKIRTVLLLQDLEEQKRTKYKINGTVLYKYEYKCDAAPTRKLIFPTSSSILLKKSTILTPTPHPPIMEVFCFELVVRFPEIAQASSSLLGCCNHHHQVRVRDMGHTASSALSLFILVYSSTVVFGALPYSTSTVLSTIGTVRYCTRTSIIISHGCGIITVQYSTVR